MDMMPFGTFRMLFLIDEGGRLDIVRGKIHTLERSIHALSLSSRNYVRSNKTPFHTRVLLSIISIPGMRVSCKRLTVNGCGSFFCKDALFGSDNERPPPRMIDSRTARTR